VRVPYLLILVFIPLWLSGCATPAQRLDARAVELGYRRMVLQGDGFDHAVYFKDGRENGDKALHVYLEGDGTPWVRKNVPASDPTPRNPLMLELMALDQAPSVYLGRPCYHGIQNASCVSEVWTSGRYSDAVVRSMSAALDSIVREYSSLVLIGYSGGGTLAMLLAERQPKVTFVVTVAANLNTDEWVALHKQHSLSGSLNPAKRAPLKPGIIQAHFSGTEDDNVPPQLVRNAIAHQPGARFRMFPTLGHCCRWQDVWPDVLGDLSAR